MGKRVRREAAQRGDSHTAYRYTGGAVRAESSPDMNDPKPHAAPAITPEIVAEHGLTLAEYERLLKILGREPSFTELGIFSVMWSEHCSYKSSRVWLARLPTKGPQVIQGPGENAGVVDIGDGDAVVFKMESHNHPSFIEPYQGAATGVGGIMRDVFTMGARPIANLNALRFGDPAHAEDAPPGGRRGGGHRRLRQLHRRAHGRRRDQLRCRLQRQHPGQRHVHRPRQGRQDLLLRRQGRGPAGGLRRLQDRARRHPRRHHGLGRVRRQIGREAPHRAGGRPVHREAADRGLPGADGHRRHRRHPGHGRRRPHLVQHRDGRQGRRRAGAGAGQGAPARDRHDGLRDDALREPGAHADGAQARPRGRGRGHLPQVGPRLRGDRPHHRYGAADRQAQRRGGGRPAGARRSPPRRRSTSGRGCPPCRPGSSSANG